MRNTYSKHNIITLSSVRDDKGRVVIFLNGRQTKLNLLSQITTSISLRRFYLPSILGNNIILFRHPMFVQTTNCQSIIFTLSLMVFNNTANIVLFIIIFSLYTIRVHTYNICAYTHDIIIVVKNNDRYSFSIVNFHCRIPGTPTESRIHRLFTSVLHRRLQLVLLIVFIINAINCINNVILLGFLKFT